MDNRQWENMYDIAKQYYKENGNLLISSKYVTAENKKLGYWIGRQRKEYKANKLSKEKVLLLEKIGMVWSIYDADWYENYALAKQYYENVGDLLIPLLYTTNNGKNLGAWIGKQRKQYKPIIKDLPKFPAVKRDFALLVDNNVRFADLRKAAFETEHKYLKDVYLFDVYEGKNLLPGKKSYALSFILQNEEDTLKDKQIESIMSRLQATFETKFNAKLR